MALFAKVLTVSDGVVAGTRDDVSGRTLSERLMAEGYMVVEHRITEDGIEPVAAALRELTAGFAGLVVTTGGTGFGPRDLTPEGTREALDREAELVDVGPEPALVVRNVHDERAIGMTRKACVE